MAPCNHFPEHVQNISVDDIFSTCLPRESLFSYIVPPFFALSRTFWEVAGSMFLKCPLLSKTKRRCFRWYHNKSISQIPYSFKQFTVHHNLVHQIFGHHFHVLQLQQNQVQDIRQATTLQSPENFEKQPDSRSALHSKIAQQTATYGQVLSKSTSYSVKRNVRTWRPTSVKRECWKQTQDPNSTKFLPN